LTMTRLTWPRMGRSTGWRKHERSMRQVWKAARRCPVGRHACAHSRSRNDALQAVCGPRATRSRTRPCMAYPDPCVAVSAMKAALPLALYTEKNWSKQVAQLAQQLGWRRYHTFRSERSQPGYPDETLIRDRVIWLELKTETGKLSDAQRSWLTALLDAGAEAYVARPRDLVFLGYVLSARHRPTGHALEASTFTELDRLHDAAKEAAA
jgi:hypothetical protein